jgi:hypothetical protein
VFDLIIFVIASWQLAPHLGQKGNSKIGLKFCGCHNLQRKELHGFICSVDQESVVGKPALECAGVKPHKLCGVVGAQLDVKSCLVARWRRDTGSGH